MGGMRVIQFFNILPAWPLAFILFDGAHRDADDTRHHPDARALRKKALLI